MRKLNILVVDDHPFFRKGLIKEISSSLEIGNLHEADNGSQAIELCKENSIDLILLDYRMPVMDGYATAKHILYKKDPPKIILLTNYDSVPLILNFFKLGVKGFLTKSADVRSLHSAIRSVLCGDYYYESKFDFQISDWIKNGLDKTVPSIRFSKREIQLVTNMSKGKTSEQIAMELNVSSRTIESCRYNLIAKTKVKNMAELIDYVYANGIL